MNVSAGEARRKWPYCRPIRRGGAILVTAVILNLLYTANGPAWARRAARSEAAAAKVPLPRPRPDDAPKAEPKVSDKTSEKPSSEEPAKPAEPAAPAPPQLSACRQALTEEIAIAPSIPAIHGPGGCGGDDLVRLEAIVLPNQHRVAVTPAATLRCPMARAIADWVRTDVVTIAGGLGTEPVGLDNFDSYECRSFNRIPGAHLSEHGRANALDVRAIKLANGRAIALTDRDQPRSLREAVLHSVCARFMTVLGPDSDWYHEEHIHLDLMERRNNYKICQWDVLDPLPKVAPFMPAARPDEAPPREVAKEEHEKGKADGAKEDAAGPAPDAAGAAAPDASGEDESKAAASAASAPPPKRVRQARRKGG